VISTWGEVLDFRVQPLEAGTPELAPAVGPAGALEPGAAVGVVGATVGDAPADADADADADGETAVFSVHRWLVPLLHVYRMMAAPSAVDLRDTSTHLPFCAFFRVYPLPDLVAAKSCSVPPVQEPAHCNAVPDVGALRQPVPVSGAIV
jgi:hypothetical protein